jgi:hypothetical protein
MERDDGMTSEWQALFALLWETAARVRGPFEIAEVVPEGARRLGQTDGTVGREIRFLLAELERLPEGKRYFTVEGNAVVPLPEFRATPPGPDAARDAYPFEL